MNTTERRERARRNTLVRIRRLRDEASCLLDEAARLERILESGSVRKGGTK